MSYMRTAYREHLENFSRDVEVLADAVENIMRKASTALLTQSLQSAEDALSASDELEDLRARCEERAVSLLALENPMAKDLRQVISSIYIVEDFHRMGQLGKHIAKIARRRHPESPIPAPYRGHFERVCELARHMSESAREVLTNPDTDGALELHHDDDEVDNLHHWLLAQTTDDRWQGDTCEAVETAMLSRYYERYADHCVNVASRIVFLNTGLAPEEYLARQEEDARTENVDAELKAYKHQFS